MNVISLNTVRNFYTNTAVALLNSTVVNILNTVVILLHEKKLNKHWQDDVFNFLKHFLVWFPLEVHLNLVPAGTPFSISFVSGWNSN